MASKIEVINIIVIIGTVVVKEIIAGLLLFLIFLRAFFVNPVSSEK
jgi:hypothetical protein